MRKNFINYTFIIFIFLINSFNIFAEREVDFEKLEYDEKTELVYVEGEKEAFTGIAKQYYEDKSLKAEVPYLNGKIEGIEKQYYPDGKLKSEANFIDGILEGKVIGYYENGNIEYEENYKNDEFNGLIKNYYESGKLKIVVNYKNAKPDGLAIAYHENGELHIEENYKDGNLISKAIYKNDELIETVVGSVVSGDDSDTEEIFVSTENENVESKLKYYTTIFTFGTVIIGLIAYTIFKIFTVFPKTNNLTDEQRNRIFKILMKYDEHKEELFSAYRLNGVGTGYYRIRSMMVDNQKVYIYAKMFSFLYIPTPITLGYLLCYNKDQILASYSNATFKEAKREIEDTVLYI
ncbi:toxin-antitoxin system YwqK family antitoxin [Fusobacterium polymorphum]|uniref:toxin-antitoxin system YwqK family antitoxin n=1 Tax=Fusobacterium nucleatum subsp. polymorphum TaxID=76857 RepID=UPI003247103C